MIIDESTINSGAIALLGIAVTAGVTFVFTQRTNHRQDARDLAAGHRELVQEVASLKERLAALDAEVMPISTAFTQVLVAKLTHMHTPELDALLAKIGPPFTLSTDEEASMYVLLHKRQIEVDDLIDSEERDAAAILGAAHGALIRMSRAEQEHIAVAGAVKLTVATPAKAKDNP